MASRRTNRRTRRARSTVFGAVAALVLLNVGLALHVSFRPGVRDPMFDLPAEHFRARVESAADHPTTVVHLGSSRTGYGIRPSVTEEEILRATGEPCLAHNLHVPANGPIGELVHWKRLVDRGPVPDVAVLEITPARFSTHSNSPDGKPAGAKKLADDMITFRGDRMSRDEVRLVQSYGFPAETEKDWWQANLNPWFGFRFQILSLVQPTWVPNTVTQHERASAADLGWKRPFFDRCKPDQYAGALAINHTLLYDRMQDIRFDETPANSFRDLVKSCLEHGTVPAVFVSPEASAIRAWYPPDLDARLKAFLAELEGMGAIVADGREWLPDEAFHDGHHAVRSWADEYTRQVTRHVVLPAVERARAARPTGGARVAAGRAR